MATLFSATLDLAKILGNVIESTSTEDGIDASTTLIDTSFPRTPPPDDAFNYGTLWFITGNSKGVTRVVTDWDQSPKPTFTFDALALDVLEGDRYAFCDRDWPRDLLRQAVNSALQTIGGVPDTYTDATFITVADQEAYTLPTGVYNVKRVEIASDKSAPYYYYTHNHWTEKDGAIYFDTGYEIHDAGYLIRLTYVVQPGELDDDADTISDYIHPDLLKWEAATHALMAKQPAMGEQQGWLQSRLAFAIQLSQSLRQRHPLPRMPKDPHLSPWAGPSKIVPDVDPGTVRL